MSKLQSDGRSTSEIKSVLVCDGAELAQNLFLNRRKNLKMDSITHLHTRWSQI